jgi:predicted transcriptional regulator of viral defense system
MTLLHALSRILAMNVPVFTTGDAAVQLGVQVGNASVVLARLTTSGQVLRLRRGVWAVKERIDTLALPEYLTAPFPAYVSLHSALYLHGMISQVPAVTYAVSLARTRRYHTPLGTVSIHHVRPSFFFGFEAAGRAGGRLATPEKALLDFLYLAPARSKLFRALPELEWPKRFSVRIARSIVKRVTPMRRQKIVARRLEQLLQNRSRLPR